jgi:nucleotide-binding universal stress UspA family protein
VGETGDGRVVVGVCESPAGLRALRYGVAEARQRRIPLVAVRAWQLPAWWDLELAARWGEDIGDGAWAGLWAAFDTALGAVPADVPVRLAVVRSQPGPALVTHASRPADLLVIGGTARRRGWLPGRTSVAWYCARYAGCPVVVVPPPALSRTPTRRLIRALHRETAGGLDASPREGR